RRRHTRFSRDWSSDVCSSDLKKPTRDQTIEERLFLESVEAYQSEAQNVRMDRIRELISGMSRIRSDMERQLALIPSTAGKIQSRSEERRVGMGIYPGVRTNRS